MASQKEFKVLAEKGFKEGDLVRTKKANRQGLIEAILRSETETIHPPKVDFQLAPV